MTLIEFPLIKIPDQPPEKYYGNKEYKFFLDSKDKRKKNILEKKATQMLFRIHEGNGIAKYIVGIKDNGEAIGINKKKLYSSLINLHKIANIIKADLKKIRFYTGSNGFIFVAHVTRNIERFELTF
jgi:GTPase